VLVVGAGPVGLVLACELARRDVPLRVIDKLPEPTDESRAIVIHARSLEMMERVGVADALIASGVRTNAFEFLDGSETLGRVELGTVDSPYPFTISTAQTETERVLTERLEELGTTVERGVELVGLVQDDDQVRSTVRDADGREEVVVSSWVGGADGSHSTVRDQVGTKLEGSFKGERFLLGDVEADCELDSDVIHAFFTTTEPPLLVFPMLGRRLRLIAQLTDERGEAEPTLELLQQVADQRAPGIALRSAHWLTVFEIHHGQVPAYRHGRAFLAGDAAHIHSPAGGQGMNTGMQDAFNLGWKLALVSSGKAPSGLLDSYHAERYSVATRVIEMSTKMTVLGTFDSNLSRRLRNYGMHVAIGLSPISHRLADEMEEVDIGYRTSPIVAGEQGHRHSVHPGDAAPDVPGLGLHRTLAAGTDHTALYIAPGGRAAPVQSNEVARHVLVSDGAPNGSGFDEVLSDPDGLVAARYGVGGEGALFLIRPDGYVALRAKLGDESALADYGARVFGV
jgi:2-polyprenyl-6-methoxyphenol hydroxylase-like FAD-dependent oxidoreductase